MTAHITAAETNAWADKYKLDLTTLDGELEDSLATQVIVRLSQVYDTSSWVDTTTTPSLVRKIIAMKYVGWYFQRTYSEDEEANNYGLMLIGQADNLIEGIVSGAYPLPGTTTVDGIAVGTPVFYPNDASSALTPTASDRSLGPARFSMGQIW
jgi:hypothetical protein